MWTQREIRLEPRPRGVHLVTREVVAALWALAVTIEDGNITDVDKALRAAQEALKQALERGASDEEIKKLTENLRAALDNFMRQLAEQLRNNPQQLARPLDPNTRMLSQQDLKNMIDRMERLSRSGDKDAARQLLEQLQQMLENLQMAQPGQSGDGDMQQALNELGDGQFCMGEYHYSLVVFGQEGEDSVADAGRRAAQAIGADMAYIGTRFLATTEAHVLPEYKQMLVDSGSDDVVYTSLFTGVKGNYLRGSVAAAGLDPDNLPEADKSKMDFGSGGNMAKKAWRDIWSAGHGVAAIGDVPSVDDLVDRLACEYAEGLARATDSRRCHSSRMLPAGGRPASTFATGGKARRSIFPRLSG